MNKVFLVICAVLLFLPNLLNVRIFEESTYDKNEQYDSALAYLNSLEKLEQHVDSIITPQNIAIGSYEYVYDLTSVIRKRFYHGYSHFSLQENWIAAVSGKLFEIGMASKVVPEEILQNQNAACSQQAIVLMAILRKKGIPYRHLAFPHHYALEAFVDSAWYYFDPNLEPNIQKKQRNEKVWHHQSDSLKKFYQSKVDNVEFVFGKGLKPLVGDINEIPAPRASFFQKATWILSRTIWCLPLLLLLLQSRNYFPYNKKR